ncbi:hypothetical protein FACS189431_3930 [Alphaproteobacteria bacterium]|nr:hypothetical protein FACS189431_3930 [Alphaproteobacteria bacterium]
MGRILGVSITLVSIAVLATFSAPVALAADHIIRIDDTNISHNQDIIFDEQNIGPGFSENYNIRVDNQSSGAVKISLHDIVEDSGNTLTLDELEMKLLYNNIVLIAIGPQQKTANDFICVGSYIDEQFALNVSLNSTLGNEYQDRSFYVEITFRADAAECENTLPGEVGTIIEPFKGTNLPLLPNTGEGRDFYYFLYGAVIFSTLLTMLFLILFIIARRRKKEDRDEENRL